MKRMADSMANLQAEINGMKQAMTGFMKRQDRDANMDEEVVILQYLPDGDPTHRLVLENVTDRVRARKITSSSAGLHDRTGHDRIVRTTGYYSAAPCFESGSGHVDLTFDDYGTGDVNMSAQREQTREELIQCRVTDFFD